MSTCRLTFDPSSVDSYRTFLKVKSLPVYRFRGRTAEFPAEYAARIGVSATPAIGEPYEPLEGLFDYQADISRWAIRKRKFAAFVRPGLGKTLIEAEFARHAARQLPGGKKVLWLAPPMVVPQTLDEIQKFYGWRLAVQPLRAAELSDWLTSDDGSRIGITNYEALKETTPQGRLGAMVLDESSMMKSAYGKWARICLRLGKGLDWKLCGTGTPAPNDRIEYANHAVFLDQFPTVNSFLAKFFVNRGQTQNRWEMKPHALRPFYRALSHWCIFVTSPGAYGWSDNSKPLPPIHIHIHDVSMTPRQHELASNGTGTLFGTAGGITSRSMLSQIAKGHLKGEEIPTAKPEYIRSLIESWPGESTLVWCRHNAEQDAMEKVLPNAGSIQGSTPIAKRIEIVKAFQAGTLKQIIAKPDILGFGLNLQIATRQVFNGLNDSYEEFYQCVMRSNRVGSKKPLNIHIPMTLIERPMVETVLQKAKRVETDAAEQERIFLETGLAQEVRGVA